MLTVFISVYVSYVPLYAGLAYLTFTRRDGRAIALKLNALVGFFAFAALPERLIKQ